MNYAVSDFIIRLKNAVLARRKQITMPYSNLAYAIGKVLVKEGFLTDIKKEETEGRMVLIGAISYTKRIPQLNDVKIISKPSLRVYTRNKKAMAERHAGTFILSTNKGIMTGREAIQKGIGGEVLFKIW